VPADHAAVLGSPLRFGEQMLDPVALLLSLSDGHSPGPVRPGVGSGAAQPDPASHGSAVFGFGDNALLQRAAWHALAGSAKLPRP
jgi:hypothetical protein